MESLVVKFRWKKETKGTHCYEEVEGPSGAVIGTLYLKKHAAAALGNPPELVVRVDAV